MQWGYVFHNIGFGLAIAVVVGHVYLSILHPDSSFAFRGVIKGDIDIPLFLQWVEEISEVLVSFNQDFSEKLAFLRGMMDKETAQRWADEALAMNHVYFAGFAEENGIEGWLPPFLAETAVRPYLQQLAQKVQPQIIHARHVIGCPVCGEPARLAILDEEGKKVIQCPRCLSHWNAKRLECPHCGNEDHETIRFITIEEDPV